jgi:hypothetical protein
LPNAPEAAASHGKAAQIEIQGFTKALLKTRITPVAYRCGARQVNAKPARLSNLALRWRNPMRSIVLSLSLCAAACGGQTPDSPTSPASAVSSVSAQTVTALPFTGSFVSATTGLLNCPPTCPPTTLRISGTAEGTATQLGRFTAEFTETVDLATATGIGTYTFIAANGDRLLVNGTGGEDEFVPPNVSHVTMTGTFVGGTGRFAGASGPVIIRSVGVIDFASQTSTGRGTLEGRITLER